MEESAQSEPPARVATDSGFAGNSKPSGEASQSNALPRALWDNLKWTFPSGIALAFAAMAVVWFFAEPNYRSLSSLVIHDKQPFLVYPTEESSASFAQTQIELLKGPFIISRAIESGGLAQLPEFRQILGKEDSVVWISRRLNAVRVGNSELYEVSYASPHPASAQRVVEAIVDTYMRFQSDQSDSRRQRLLEVLQEELTRYDAKIELARRRLLELAKVAEGGEGFVVDALGNGGGADRSVGRFSLTSTLQQKLVDAEVEVEMGIARVHALRKMAAEPIEIPPAQIAAALGREPEIVVLIRELAAKRKALDQANQPDATTIREEIATKQKELDARKEELRAQLTAEVESTIAVQRRDALRHAQEDLNQSQEVTVRLRERLSESRSPGNFHARDRSLELQYAREELRSVEDARKRISERMVQIQTEGRAPGQVVRIQTATLPEFPDGPTLIRPLAVVGVFAFIAPFLLLAGWDLIHRRHHRIAA
jgi:hypothetical protein